MGPLGEDRRRSRVTDLQDVFDRCPGLQAAEHRVTSEANDRYNCVSWLERDFSHRWDPEFFWPRDLPCPEGIPDLGCYLELFQRWGFESCEGGALEPGFLKIAIYSKDGYFHHVAKQLRIDAWSSKM